MYTIFKRFLDVVFALFLILLLSPVMMILVILIRVKLGTPVLFKQERPGLDEKIFTLYKFRTMADFRDENGDLLPDSERFTPFGLFLRKASLDELPELFNIIGGEMSFIGPRPLLVRYLPYYRDEERKRHSVRPGITGLAQVSGRNRLSWDDRFKFDVEYVDNMSLWLDIKIFIKTIIKVISREDYAQDLCALDDERK